MIELAIASIVVGIAVFAMKWSFTIINGRIYLPKDRQTWRIFDKINDERPDFFRLIASISASTTVLLFGVGATVIWWISAVLFLTTFGVYLFTCARSYFLLKRDFSGYHGD